MASRPIKKHETRRAAVLEALMEGPHTAAELRKKCRANALDLVALQKAGTIAYDEKFDAYRITDDGRILVRIARKKAAAQ